MNAPVPSPDIAAPPSAATPAPWTYRGRPVHRVILLWLVLVALVFCALQTGWRFWLMSAGTPVVGEVTVAADSCRTRHRANCFLGRAIVNPRMDAHKLNVSKIPGGRFYTVGETVEMRIYPHDRMYFAAVYTPVNWLLGPIRTAVIALLLLFAALMPARRPALWLTPVVIVLFLTLG
ncbi:MAG TPA: hypothetical protein VGE64_06325 [Xanthomonadaceae bacterium]